MSDTDPASDATAAPVAAPAPIAEPAPAPEPVAQPVSAPAATAPASVTALDEFFDTHVRNSVYSVETELYNKIHGLYQSLRALLHSKS